MKYPLTFKGNPNGPVVGKCSYCKDGVGSEFITLNGGALEKNRPFLSITSHHNECEGLSLVGEIDDYQYEFYFCDSNCLRKFFNAIVDDVADKERKPLADLNALNLVAEELKNIAYTEIKGEDAGKFVFITNTKGTIEFSCNAQDSYWVEYWKPHKDDAIMDKTFFSANEAIESIKQWLL